MSDERIGEVLGVWRLVSLIGSGGMGTVYLAERIDGVVRQNAAVKILRASDNDDSLDEVDTIRRLTHQNIARYFGHGFTNDGHGYLVMEHVEGNPITEYADQKGLTVRDRLRLFAEACRAIEHAHHHLVVHLDIKPGNVLVSRDGVVKIIDFGIARRLRGGHVEEAPNAFSGPYASPEQIQPASTLGYPADVYALGALLYELLSGHEPFNPRLAAGELERQILEEIPRLPSDAAIQPQVRQSQSGRCHRLEPEAVAKMRGCGPSELRRQLAGDLDRICLFALRKEASRRYRSVDDLRADVQSVLDGRKPAIARSGDPLYSALRAARRRHLELIAVAGAFAAVYGGIRVFDFVTTGTRASIESTRHFEQTIEFGLGEMRKDLRPKLAADPQLRRSLEVLDGVLKAATPVPAAGKTTTDELREEFELIRQRLLRIILKVDLSNVR